MARIGLVTVLFKSDDVLPGFFRSISQQTHREYILYLVDNSENITTDALISRCQEDFPVTLCRHIKTGGNTGVAAGNNTGIRAALEDECTHILLLNNDIEFSQEDMFTRLLETAEVKGESLIVNRIFYYGENKLWMAGGYMDEWRALGVHYGYNKPDGPLYHVPRYITYAPTCFMLVKKEVIEKIGMMDERYFAYYDDTDFVLRATRAGFRIWYDPSLVVLHKVSSSAGTNSPFYVYYSNRNKIYFIRKNFRGIRRWFALAYTLVSRVVFWLRFDPVRRKKLTEGLKEGFAMKP